MSWTPNTLGVKCEPPLFKEMYKLAKDKKASRMFIVNEILDDGFNASAQGKYFFVSQFARVLILYERPP